jgi:hypothetical protein
MLDHLATALTRIHELQRLVSFAPVGAGNPPGADGGSSPTPNLGPQPPAGGDFATALRHAHEAAPRPRSNSRAAPSGHSHGPLVPRTVVGRETADPGGRAGGPARPVQPLAAPLSELHPDATSGSATAAPDPRWTEILERSRAALARGARGPSSPDDPIPIYAASQDPAVESRRRADGSLDPADLPSTEGLSDSDLLTLRLANSAPSLALAEGQNEGVARPGQPQAANDSYDLLAWVAQLQAMAAGRLPPFRQDNGYVWTPIDIQRNLEAAIAQVEANKRLYNARWEARWALLRAHGYGAVADQEEATVRLANASETPTT